MPIPLPSGYLRFPAGERLFRMAVPNDDTPRWLERNESDFVQSLAGRLGFGGRERVLGGVGFEVLCRGPSPGSWVFQAWSR